MDETHELCVYLRHKRIPRPIRHASEEEYNCTSQFPLSKPRRSCNSAVRNVYESSTRSVLRISKVRIFRVIPSDQCGQEPLQSIPSDLNGAMFAVDSVTNIPLSQ